MATEHFANLLFDLGGVIMDIEKERCVAAFERLGLRNAASYFGDYTQQGVFAALESGAVTPAEFRAELRRGFDHPVTDAEIDAAFTAFLIGIPRHRLAELRELRRTHGVYLLSNTNPIMWNGFIASQFRQEGLEIADYFDGMVTSFEAKSMKPAAAIFDYAAQKLGIEPAQTLFLDDSEANCQAARALGWHAAVVPPGTEFATILASLHQ